jgi:MFS family permease
MQHSRSNVFALSACQALLVMNNVMMISIGTLAADTLAANKLLVTLPATGYIIGAGAATLPMSHYMKRHGRRAGFLLGCVFGVCGALLAAAAIWLHQFWLLCLATVVSGVYNGTGGFYRFAAADVASADFRSKAISLVLAGGIAGGILGPESSKLTRELLGPVFLGSFLSLVALAGGAMLILRRLEIPLPSAEERSGEQRAIGAIVRQPVFIVAALGGICAYGVMNLLMAAAPLAMQMCGHAYSAQVLVIEWHIVAMFAPAFFTGWLISRFGVLPIMFAGVLLKLTAIWVAAAGIAVANFWLAMVLIGVGWCFLFVGGTTLLTEAYSPAEKAKTQGVNDLLIYLTMSTSSLLSGAILYRYGWNPLNYSALPLLTITGTCVLWLAQLRRIAAPRAASAAK